MFVDCRSKLYFTNVKGLVAMFQVEMVVPAMINLLTNCCRFKSEGMLLTKIMIYYYVFGNLQILTLIFSDATNTANP